MAFLRLGGRGDDGLWEGVVFPHAFRQGHAAQRPAPIPVRAPSMSGQVAPNHHFQPNRFAASPDGHVWIGCVFKPGGHDVRHRTQHVGGELIQHLPLERDGARQDHIERGNAVARHHQQAAIFQGVHVADFAAVELGLALEVQLLLVQGGGVNGGAHDSGAAISGA